MTKSSANGDWIRTLIGAIGAVGVAISFLYTVVIIPVQERIRIFEAGREDDRKELVKLYLSIRENDQYKIFAQSERVALRHDIEKLEGHILRIENEQKQRTSVISSMPALDKKLDGIIKRHEDLESKMSSSYTLNDALKSLRAELEELRHRVMVPVTSNSK